MSAAQTYLLFCDTPGCEEMYVASDTLGACLPPRRLAKVRASAAVDGWTSRVVEPGHPHQFARTVDTCAICSAEARGDEDPRIHGALGPEGPR